jgi:predicted transcriptional regulator
MAFKSVEEREQEALALDVRRKIYELVKKSAGCHFRELERRSGLATGSIRYHLHYLVKQGLLSEVKNGNTVHYIPQAYSSTNKKLLALLRQQSIRRILVCILNNPKCTHEKVVRFVRKTNFSLAINKKELMNLLITHQESFFDSVIDKVIDMWDV